MSNLLGFLPSFIEIRCFFWDELLPRYGGDYFINSYKDPVMNQPSIMESRRFFLVAHLMLQTSG